MADGTKTNGLMAALQILGARGEQPGEVEQGEFFENTQAPAPVGKSGPQGGRPRGVANKSTQEWVRYLLGQHRAPLMVCAEIYSRPTAELVDELQAMADKHKKWRETKEGGYWNVVQIDPLQVMKLQRDCAVALLPYVHKQQPKAIEVEGSRRGVIVLEGLEEAEFDDVGDLAVPTGESLEKQRTGFSSMQQSDETKSDEGKIANDIGEL